MHNQNAGKKPYVRIFSLFLVIILFISTLFGTPYAVAASGFTFEGGVADPDTFLNTGFDDMSTKHNGRIWTDKSVSYPGSGTDFEITLSALSQSFPLTEGYTIPSDTVFIIDVSGSMADPELGLSGRLRIDILIEALNEAIGILQDVNPKNRVAVVAYGGASGGSARVEHLLLLGRYSAEDNKFFTFIPHPTEAGHHLRLNNIEEQTTNEAVSSKDILVQGSTPTQWGIYEGAGILQEVDELTAEVPRVDKNGTSQGTVKVTRRPNIILMTDGEPTMAWRDYAFSESVGPNPVLPGAVAPYSNLNQLLNTHGDFFYGDGIYGEMGVSLLTVLTAAHRKQLVYDHYFEYFDSEGKPPLDQAAQPEPSVGFYTIGLGVQTEPAKSIIQATMDPFNVDPYRLGTNYADNLGTAKNRSAIKYVGGLDADPNLVYPLDNTDDIATAGVTVDANEITAGEVTDGEFATSGVTTFDITAADNMGDLLREFAESGNISFLAQRRMEVYYHHEWEEVALAATENLSLDQIDYATDFFEATNLNGLRKAFESITTNIQGKGMENVTNTHGGIEDFDGYLVFSDVLGEYMEFKEIKGLWFDNDSRAAGSAGADFGEAVDRRDPLINHFSDQLPENTNMLEAFQFVLYEHLNYGSTNVVEQMYVNDLIAAHLAAGYLQDHGSIKYYADEKRDFLGSFFDPTGAPVSESAIPADASAIVEAFYMWGTVQCPVVDKPKPLMLVSFQVITVLEDDYSFDEIFADAANPLPLERNLNKGDQMIRWYIPAALIPLRKVTVAPDSGDVKVTGNELPIRVRYTVGPDMDRISDAIDNGSISVVAGSPQYFYTNHHFPAPVDNMTFAFYQPHNNNPYYNNETPDAAYIDIGLLKTINRTGTAEHVTFNRHSYTSDTGLTKPGFTDGRLDMHWLGNNGRLTLKLGDSGRPSADLTITKIFEGLPAGSDVFKLLSPITFLVVGNDSKNKEIYRNIIDFNADSFTWNSGQSRYEFTLNGLPLGNYLVYERGGHAAGFILSRLEPPQLLPLTVDGEYAIANFVNRYTPVPPPENLPALTIRKVFHGLSDNEIPSWFQMRVTGPGGFNKIMNLNQSLDGYTFEGLDTGEYAIEELNNTWPGISTPVITINGQRVTMPYTFTVAGDAHITINVDNTYSPPIVPPPTTPPSTTPPNEPPGKPPTTTTPPDKPPITTKPPIKPTAEPTATTPPSTNPSGRTQTGDSHQAEPNIIMLIIGILLMVSSVLFGQRKRIISLGKYFAKRR